MRPRRLFLLKDRKVATPSKRPFGKVAAFARVRPDIVSAEMRQGALDANWGPRKCAVLEAYLADAWIAATALVLSASLVTNNPKDYRQAGQFKAWVALAHGELKQMKQ